MKSTFRVLFYVKKDKQKANGNYPIMCRITIDGEASRFNTKLDVKPENWDGKSGRAMGRSMETTRLNSMLDEVKSSLHQIYHELQRREQVTAEKMKNEFLGHTENHETLLNLFAKHNEDVKTLVGKSKSAATYQKYEVTRKHLAKLIQSKYNLSDFALRSVSNMVINDFEVYLVSTAGCSHNTTAKFMQFFKHILNLIKKGQISIIKILKGFLKKLFNLPFENREMTQNIRKRFFKMPKKQWVKDQQKMNIKSF